MNAALCFLALLVGSQSAVVKRDASYAEDLEKLANILHAKSQNRIYSPHEMEVFTQYEEVTAVAGHAAVLPCDYSISSGEDLPVMITWKIGDGPRFAQDVFQCEGYTKASKSCQTSQVLDKNFIERVTLANNFPSLFIIEVQKQDNRNFWCHVALQDGELGVDMKSISLTVKNSDQALPKFHSVEVDDNVLTHVGDEVTLHCICSKGSHCDDVFWFKGPTNLSNTGYDLVYSRESFSPPTPTEYKAYNSWIGRTHLYGNSLVISDTELSDAGRYWCEIRSSGFYGIGEMATDAKSVVLEVQEADSTTPDTFSCLGEYDGLYFDPEDCVAYYECFGGLTAHRRCPAGTVFNPDPDALYACDFEHNVAPPCGAKTERSSNS